KERPRRHLKIRILSQPVVKHHDAERIEQLSLVFVNPFNLAIKDGVRVHRKTHRGLNPPCKSKLRLALRLAKVFAKSPVVRQRLQLAQLTKICGPTVADS